MWRPKSLYQIFILFCCCFINFMFGRQALFFVNFGKLRLARPEGMLII